MLYSLLLKVLLKLSYIRFILRSAGANLSFPLVKEVVNVNNTEKENNYKYIRTKQYVGPF